MCVNVLHFVEYPGECRYMLTTQLLSYWQVTLMTWIWGLKMACHQNVSYFKYPISYLKVVVIGRLYLYLTECVYVGQARIVAHVIIYQIIFFQELIFGLISRNKGIVTISGAGQVNRHHGLDGLVHSLMVWVVMAVWFSTIHMDGMICRAAISITQYASSRLGSTEDYQYPPILCMCTIQLNG